MLFLRPRKFKKRKQINDLKSALLIVLSLFIGACSTTPKATSSIDNTPAAPNNSASATADSSALNRVFNATDDGAPSQLDRLYSSDRDTIWQRLRDGYQLDSPLDNPQIDKEIQWYRQNPTFVYRSTERSSRYMHYVVSAAQQRNMPTELALLPFIESAYDPFAYSRSGAAGLWQFVPQTATTFGLARNWWYDGRKDVVASTDAALTYLQFLHDKFNHDWLLAIAAYNCGEGTVQRAIDANRSKGLATDFWHLNLREETRSYVPRLIAFAKIVNAPHRYGINLYSIPDQAYFAAVDTQGQIDLTKAASLAAIEVDELYRLNPGLSHATVVPQAPQRLLLPLNAVDRFTRELASLPVSERASWKHYDVAKGDTLASIARKFAIDAAALRKTNNLGRGLLRPGQELLIPQGGHSAVETAENAPAPVTTQTPFGSTQIFHTVQAGDNLRRLAQHYAVNIKDIQRWNGLGPDDSIKLGQKLNIWTDEVGSKPAKMTASGAPKKVGYTVQNGDSLTAIASKFNIEIEDILRWNQVNPRALLQPGQRLTLFLAK